MAWECAQCGYYLELNNPPPECPECGAQQEQLFWVDEDVDERGFDDGDGEGVFYDEEELDEDEEDYVPELGDEFGAAMGEPRDRAYLRSEEEE